MHHLYNIFTGRHKVNLDIGNKCTLECIACSRQTNRFKGTPIPGKDMTISQWEKICKGFRFQSLCGQISDPIFNPNLQEFIKICKKYGNTMSIHTAATSKKHDWNWYLKTASIYPEGVVWKFGIDGLPDTSPLYRTNQDSEFLFDTMLKLRKLNMRVCWQYIIFSFNEHQLEEAHKIAKKHSLNMQVKKSSRFFTDVARPKQKENYVRKENNVIS
tara:strand:- start:266 stop:910 length:645 start_codon:yes stop_codon:yes gene_type:complete